MWVFINEQKQNGEILFEIENDKYIYMFKNNFKNLHKFIKNVFQVLKGFLTPFFSFSLVYPKKQILKLRSEDWNYKTDS